MDKQEWTIGLSLTERCNEKCKHCYIGRKNVWKQVGYRAVEMDRKQVDALIPQFIDENVTRLNFGGGEAALHPEFIQIVKDLVAAGIKVSLTTNGSTFPVYRDHLYLFNDIGVSIDLTPEEHGKFRGNPKAFEWAKGALDELVRQGVRNEMVSCIMSINYDQLPLIYAMANDIGVDMWRLNRFQASRNDKVRLVTINGIDEKVDRMNQELLCTPDQMREAYEFLASVTPKQMDYAIPDPVFRTLVGGNGVTPGTPYGRTSFRIKSNGDVTPDVFTDHAAGNVFREPLRDILENPFFRRFRERTPEGKCVECVNFHGCQGGDMTDSYLLLEDIDKQDPFCFLDPHTKKDTREISIGKTRHVHESYLATIYVPIRGMKS